MASGFESSSFKRTFTVEKRDDGTTLISYKLALIGRGWLGILLFAIPIIGGIFLIPGILERFLPLPIDGLQTFLFDTFQIILRKKDIYDYLRLLPGLILCIFLLKGILRKGKITIHEHGLEFLGKKLAFKDINSTGTMSFGGGTSVYSVNGVVQSSTNQKTYGVYANAFGQDVILTERVAEEATADGILEVIRQAMHGQPIQAQETRSNPNPSIASNNKVIDWVLNHKYWAIAIFILLILLF